MEIEIPVESIPSRSIQKWLTEIPVRQGGMGLETQTGLRGPAFIGGLEMALPFFKGEGGICPPLGEMIEDSAGSRYRRVIGSG